MQKELQKADWIQVVNQLTFKYRNYSGLYAWAQGNHNAEELVSEWYDVKKLWPAIAGFDDGKKT